MILHKSKNILIADDHLLVRLGLEMICKQNFSEYNLHFASNINEIIEQFNKISSFELLILDINLEEDNSLFFINKIFSFQKNLPILIYTGLNNRLLPYKLQNLEIKGFLNKTSDEEEIIDSIKQVLSGNTYFPNKENIPTRERHYISIFEELSLREMEIMQLWMKGYGNIEISNKLNIRSNTISTYKKRILDKLNMKNQIDLVEFYKLYFTLEEYNSNTTL